LRPGKFRWDYAEPYQQQIVADGSKIWIYDADLEQVTVKKADAQLGNTPGQLLSTDKPLEESFVIEQMETKRGIDWVRLTPRDNDVNFTEIQIGFDKKNLREMQLVDNLGQTTRLVFSNVKRNVAIDKNKFVFSAPQGVDVFQADEN
jgi:outer membrane lipoprotein carrier protein